MDVRKLFLALWSWQPIQVIDGDGEWWFQSRREWLAPFFTLLFFLFEGLPDASPWA